MCLGSVINHYFIPITQLLISKLFILTAIHSDCLLASIVNCLVKLTIRKRKIMVDGFVNCSYRFKNGNLNFFSLFVRLLVLRVIPIALFPKW
jgi:hypothetical protein